MRVLVACEYSATVRDAFRAKGHDAWSCDILPTDGDPTYHIQGDVLEHLDDGWDMMIAHPPCTFLTNSGVHLLYKDETRWDSLDEGAEFFRRLLEADIPLIAVENPVPHKYAVERIGGKYTQLVQPWMFGHPERKGTCLWLKGLPKLVETDNVREEMKLLPKKLQQKNHYLPPSEERWKLRSKTYQGLADAMAEQWGGMS